MHSIFDILLQDHRQWGPQIKQSSKKEKKKKSKSKHTIHVLSNFIS